MIRMTGNTADKVLVINVDNDILDFLIQGLQDVASISFTSKGSLAVEMVRMNKPDLILLNLEKSDLNGFEVCQALKADPISQHIPVVFLTRIGGAKNTARALELGAIEYITEPIDLDAVNDKVRNYLAQINASRASERAKETPPAAKEQPPEQRPQGMSLTKFLMIILIFAVLGGGGYAWYTNKLPMDMQEARSLFKEVRPLFDEARSLFDDVLNTVMQTEPAEQMPAPEEMADEEELVEEAVPEISEDVDEQPSMESLTETTIEPPEPTLEASQDPVASIDTCGDIPEVPWWGNATHDSIIAYVNFKNDGDWDVYITKWERQLTNLQDIHGRGGAVITPIEHNRLHGDALAEYISKFESRLNVSRCLADRNSAQ